MTDLGEPQYSKPTDQGCHVIVSAFISLGGKVQPARVEFAAPKCAVLESDKLVRIGVTRTGNTKITASVK